jgi:hypothetical protein
MVTNNFPVGLPVAPKNREQWPEKRPFLARQVQLASEEEHHEKHAHAAAGPLLVPTLTIRLGLGCLPDPTPDLGSDR